MSCYGGMVYGGSQPDSGSLIQTVYTVTHDIGMGFEIDKSRILVIRRDKESECEEITIVSGE